MFLPFSNTQTLTYVLVQSHSWWSSGLCWRLCAKPQTSLWVWMLNFSNQHRCSLNKHTSTQLNEHVCVLMIYLSVWLHNSCAGDAELRNADYIQLFKQYSFPFTSFIKVFTKKHLKSQYRQTKQFKRGWEREKTEII